MLYQQLWQNGQELDEEVPPELTDLHARWRSKFRLPSPKRLPRFCNLLNHSIIKQELHAFSDDSLKSYGAVVYCRITYPDHPPAVSLITPEIESTHNISSNLHITLAISAWCLKFCDQIRHDRPDSDTRNKHLTGAEFTWHNIPKEPPQEALPPGVCSGRNPPSAEQQEQSAAKQPSIT